MLALLGIIPGLGNLIQFIVGKVYDSKVSIIQAKLGVNREVAVKMLESAVAAEHENTAKLQIYASSTLLTLLLVGFSIPILAFEWKVIVWDITLGLGSTDPIRGQVAEWANTIIAFLFGSATVNSVAKMWFSKDRTKVDAT